MSTLFDRKSLKELISLKNDKVDMTIRLKGLKVSQALTLQAMFEMYKYLGGVGSSRNVALFVDGDGDFHVKPEYQFSREIPVLNEEIKALALKTDDYNDKIFDHNDIGWAISIALEDKQKEIREYVKKIFK